MPNKEILRKKIEKKRVKKNQKMFLKNKNGKKENKGRYEHFFFLLTLSSRTVSCFIVLFSIFDCCNCFTVILLINSTRGRAVHKFEKNNLSSITNDFILWGGKACYIIAEVFVFILSFFVCYILSFGLVRLSNIRFSARAGAHIQCSSRSHVEDVTITNVIIKPPDRKWTGV